MVISYITNPTWDDAKKVASRREVIVASYREIFGRQSVPTHRQYWTLCGAYVNRKTGALLHGELGQLVDEGLIVRQQFHGVDRDERVVEDNRQIHPDVSWHHGDFKDVMGQYPGFDPAIINYDGVSEPERGAKYLKRIMRLVDDNVPGDVMLVANFVLGNPYDNRRQYEGIEVVERLREIYRAPAHWAMRQSFYRYDGSTSRAKTTMGMFVFSKTATSCYSDLEVNRRRRSRCV